MFADADGPCSWFAELNRLLESDARARARRVRSATRVTSRKAPPVLKKRMPVAFGKLRESAHAEASQGGAQTVVDALHAVHVEVGARPHWVPLGLELPEHPGKMVLFRARALIGSRPECGRSC
jgi:hypothetical protein